MSYHISNLGSFGGYVQRYTDINGYVPQEGDRHEDMKWDYTADWTDDMWSDFLSDAIEHTAEAEIAITEWRETND